MGDTAHWWYARLECMRVYQWNNTVMIMKNGVVHKMAGVLILFYPFPPWSNLLNFFPRHLILAF